MTSATADGAAELVARIQAGDRRAEEELIERFGRGIRLLLRRDLGARAEADDLFQETFRLALRKIPDGELREPAKLGGFLAGLAHNLAIGHLRHEARDLGRAGPGAVERLAASSPSPLGSLLAHERASLVRRVLAELGNPRDRRILFRFYLAGDDKQEICRDLGLGSLHFNRVLHRARQRYRKLYEKTAGDRGSK